MWSVIASLISLFGALAGSDTVQVKCPKSGRYVHVRPLTQCKEYYYCNNGTAVFQECPQDTVFSSKEKMCKATGECHELVCAGRIDGIYADPTENCTRVYECSGGKVNYVHTCAKDGAQCSEIERENKCPSIVYSTALIFKKHDICRTKQNDLYALNDCSKYVKCLDGKEVSLYICPHGKKFNGARCVENYKCGNICSMKEDGLYADESANCKQFVSCKNQLVVSRHRCPSGTVFDGTSCIVSSANLCPSFKKCQRKQNGLHADYFRNCSSYFECFNETVIYEKSCTEGKNFNGSHCVPQSMFFCQGPNLSPDCLGKKGFFINWSSGCNIYYFCAFGNKIIFKCPKNHIFNGKHCVLKNQFQCVNQKNSNEEKYQGYNYNIQSKCQLFYFCIEDDLNQNTLICQQGEIINGQECVKILNSICPYKDKECINKSEVYFTNKLKKEEAAYENVSKSITLKCGLTFVCNFSSENICTQIKKGYITDVKCNTYFICSNYSLTASGRCEHNQVFNGETCVQNNNFQCQIQPKSCQGLNNGFYQDIESRCKNYFFCINGIKTELTCPAGKIHNGDVCVRQNHYQCPTKLFFRQNIFHYT